MGKGQFLQINGVWKIGYPQQKNEIGLPYSKINLKWIKDLHVRPETLKLLEENIGGKLLNTDLGKDVLNLTSKAKAMKVTNK